MFVTDKHFRPSLCLGLGLGARDQASQIMQARMFVMGKHFYPSLMFSFKPKGLHFIDCARMLVSRQHFCFVLCLGYD